MAVLVVAVLSAIWIGWKIWKKIQSWRNRESVFAVPLKGKGKGKSRSIEITTGQMQRVEDAAYSRGMQVGIERARSMHRHDLHDARALEQARWRELELMREVHRTPDRGVRYKGEGPMNAGKGKGKQSAKGRKGRIDAAVPDREELEELPQSLEVMKKK